MPASTPASFAEDNDAFESWLRGQCDVDEADLDHKHARMTESDFVFLRATYFRWARTIENICRDDADAPEALAVGDIHVENYGVWRDREGRLVWGVNDFDEAAIMPYVFDLVRLAVSAFMAPDRELSDGAIVAAILSGYERGLEYRRATVLDMDHIWLRPLVMCKDKGRTKFWKELHSAAEATPTRAAARALMHGLPRRAENVRFVVRPMRGGGSLGKPRCTLIADWRGASLVREAKAATPSAWDGRMQSAGRARARSSWRAAPRAPQTRSSITAKASSCAASRLTIARSSSGTT
jgi:uncharacterized protein (DUF2252 family)